MSKTFYDGVAGENEQSEILKIILHVPDFHFLVAEYKTPENLIKVGVVPHDPDVELLLTPGALWGVRSVAALVLSHFEAGVNITTPAYVAGLENALTHIYETDADTKHLAELAIIENHQRNSPGHS